MVSLLGYILAFVALLLLAYRESMRAHVQLRDRDRQDRLRERREDELMNRLGHAYDKPWQEPPAAEPDRDDDEDELELAYDASHIEDDFDLEPAGSF